jgi:hypothetical protein
MAGNKQDGGAKSAPTPLDHLPAVSKSGDLNVIIETPKGCRNKFKYEPELGLFIINVAAEICFGNISCCHEHVFCADAASCSAATTSSHCAMYFSHCAIRMTSLARRAVSHSCCQ